MTVPGGDVTGGQQAAGPSFEKRMEALIGYGDPEISHGVADDILCEALRALGQDELVEIFERVPKWYA